MFLGAALSLSRSAELSRHRLMWIAEEVIRAEFAPLHGASQEGALRLGAWRESGFSRTQRMCIARTFQRDSKSRQQTLAKSLPEERIISIIQMRWLAIAAGLLLCN